MSRADESGPDIPTLFVHWERFTGWLLDRTALFPKRLRFTLTNRIENNAIDVFELIIDARYSRNRMNTLNQINRNLEILRLLLRLAHSRRVLDSKSLGYACREIDTAGRMVGGWIRHQRGQS